MSDNKIPLGDIYDLTKNIKNVEINTGFILGLERVLIFFLTQIIEDKTTITPMFKKFESLLDGKTKPDTIEFNEIESHVYTIFALQQLLRSLAFEQDLVSKNNRTIDAADAKELVTAYLSNDLDKAKELIEKIQQ